MDKSELFTHLDEQLLFLKKSIADFDTHEIEAKRAATVIRTLVHDTKNSHSLLGQLNAKGIRFINTNAPKNALANWQLDAVNMSGNIFNEKTPYFGIVGKAVTGSPAGITINYFPIYKAWTNYTEKLDFDIWWNAEIYDNKQGDSLSRKGLILNIANKDGGTHIDNLKREYKSFKQSDVLKFNVDGDLQGADNIPAYSAVMQIAWELNESINAELTNLRS